MSSILDALEKLESAPPPAAPGSPPPRPTRRRALIAAGVLAAFAAGVGIAAWLLRAPTPVPAAPLVASAPEPAPADVAPDTPEPAHPAAAAGARRAAPTFRERPWAEVVEDEAPAAPSPPPAAAEPPVARRPAPAALPAAEPAPAASVAATPPAASRATPPAAAPRTRATPPPAPEARASPAKPARARPPAGAPAVRISFLIYSRTPERRSVALTLDGTGMVTLREGQATQGLEVVEIRPDGAEMAWQGERFTVPARN